ncbi:MAG: hypothetical protein ABIR71_05045 [Chthoniobacterales bacterium]
MKFGPSLLVACLALPSLLGAETTAPDSNALRDRIVAHAKTVGPDDYAYTRTVRSEQVSSDKSKTNVIVERWDPTKTGAARWTLVSVDGRVATAEESKDYAKGLPKRRQTHYGRVAGYFEKPFTTTLDARGRTVLSFAALPKETVMVAGTDLSANATAEAIVNTSGAVPFFEEVRFRSTKPSRLKLVAKIEQFESVTRYRLMPDGKAAPSEFSSEMKGSMLGQEGSIRTRITYSDQRPTGK